jgi:nucleoside-diphosphate-sugar epimerase
MFQNEEQLENALSEPSPEVIETLGDLEGTFLILGAAGKMGLSMARMVQRAAEATGGSRRVIAVSRFSTVNDEAAFHSHGIETIRCDLLDESRTDQLPFAENVIAMLGMKFGSSGNESMTWAMNAWLPSLICRRYRSSRIVAFSTGNVYPLTPVATGGSRESDVLRPVGEYAMSAVGRERMYEYFSQRDNIPMALIRLNYACDLRYGVLVDLARKVYSAEPIDLSMGYFNTIWQGDANAWALQSFANLASPAWVVNVTGPETLSVREVAAQMAERMNRPIQFTGTEAETALLSNTDLAQQRFAPLRISTAALIDGVADWVSAGGRFLGKPTHFESRDGKF